MPAESRIDTIVLTVRYGTRASYYLDWHDAFERAPGFRVSAFNLFRRGERRAARRAIATAELIVALHPCTADTLAFIAPLEGALKARRGRLLMFVGNEYNLPWARLADKRELIRRVGADWVGTQLPLAAGEWLYRDTGATVLALPHALNDGVFRRDKADAARAIDIGGRSFRYPAFLGDDERNRVYDAFARFGAADGLHIDIANDARLDRPGWAGFLNDCRATIGTEAGSWYLERDDRTVLAIRDYLRGGSRLGALRADGMLHRATRHLPYAVKARLGALLRHLPIRHEAVDAGDEDFADIAARFFADRPHCPEYSKCISSRHFDAAGTGTCQILMRGRYNDILVADEHYIPLDADLGNVGLAVERFRDPGERQRIAGAAFDHMQSGHTYRHRVAALHGMLSSAGG